MKDPALCEPLGGSETMEDLPERKASSIRGLYGCQSGSREKPLGFHTPIPLLWWNRL